MIDAAISSGEDWRILWDRSYCPCLHTPSYGHRNGGSLRGAGVAGNRRRLAMQDLQKIAHCEPCDSATRTDL